jgi:hypothetical protein
MIQNREDFDYPEVTITGAQGSHLPGRSNDDVNGLNLRGAQLRKFPKNIEKTFKNLTSIRFDSCILPEIRQSDLKVFPGLKFLYLYENQLKVLEPGLFKFNPLLQRINLDRNPFKFIDAKVFSDLKNLTSLHLGDCEGVGDYIGAFDREQVLLVVKKVEKGECKKMVPWSVEAKTSGGKKLGDGWVLMVFGVVLGVFNVIKF